MSDVTEFVDHRQASSRERDVRIVARDQERSTNGELTGEIDLNILKSLDSSWLSEGRDHKLESCRVRQKPLETAVYLLFPVLENELLSAN